MTKNTNHQNAPIVLLLGTSTAGKSTICHELLTQNQTLPEGQRLDWQVWGQDLALEEFLKKAAEIGIEMFGDDERFKKIIDNGMTESQTVHAVGRGELKDEESVKILKLVKTDQQDHAYPLDDKNFEEALEQFIKDTEGRYAADQLRALKSLAEEKREDFKAALPSLNEMMFERVIENSRQGEPTILDCVPVTFRENGRDVGMPEKLQNFLAEKDHQCQVHTSLVHVPIEELTKRMEARNQLNQPSINTECVACLLPWRKAKIY